MLFQYYLSAWVFARKLDLHNYIIEKVSFQTWRLKELQDEIAFPPVTGA